MRLLLWIGKWAAATILIGTITIMIAWYTVNAYVDSVLRYFELDPDRIRVSMTDILAQVAKDWQADGPALPAQDGTRAFGGADNGVRFADADADEGAGPVQEEGEAASDAAPAPDDAVAVWGRIAQAQEAAGRGGELVVSLEQFDQVRNAMTNEDKIRILAIVSNLPQESIQVLSQYMEDGLTLEELAAMQDMLESFLTKEQFDEIMRIMRKY
jgi:hypothetical protein